MTGSARHLLVLPGIGGPTPREVVPSVGALAATSWIHHAEDLYDTDRDVPVMTTVRDLPLMRQTGDVIAVQSDGEAREAALALHGRRPLDGILTFSESAVAVAADIAEALGLRSNSPAAVRRLTSKYLQRQALDAAGVPVPRYAPVRSLDDVDAAAAIAGFPSVLKPVRGGGSMLTTLVRTPGELRDAAIAGLAAVAASASAPGKARLLRTGEAPCLILEELLRGERWHGDPRYGDYVSVESAVYDGEIQHLSMSDKAPLAGGFRESGSFAPSTLPPGRIAQIYEMTSAALRALGVRYGITHTECKLTADGPRIIEVNGRLGGGVWKLLRLAAGYDVIAEAAHAALGLRPMRPAEFTAHAGFLTPCLAAELSGQRLRVTIDPAFGDRPGVTEFLDVRVGTFDVALGGGIAAMAVVRADTAEGLHAHAEALAEAMTVTVPAQ